MNLKNKLIKELIEKEGGFVNHSSDSGKATKFGITHSVAHAHGYFGNMRDFPIEKAFEIYSRSYWDVNNLDDIAEISEKITEKFFDISVNMGVKIAGVFLQRTLNVFNRKERDFGDLSVDGKIGEKTLQALRDYLKNNSYGEENILKSLKGLQLTRYIQIAENKESQEDFINGWIRNRIS